MGSRDSRSGGTGVSCGRFDSSKFINLVSNLLRQIDVSEYISFIDFKSSYADLADRKLS